MIVPMGDTGNSLQNLFQMLHFYYKGGRSIPASAVS